ncbi:MAG: biotin transporter BioY [Sphaerochaetaceae bacterium]|jgi:biotin transport system substrate-specific component
MEETDTVDEQQKRTLQTRNVLVTALFAALMAVGAYIKVPIPPVPVTLQTLFVLTAGLMCGWKIGLASVAVYLFIGAIGMPVFTSGGGIAAMIGPTGGFLFGLIPAVLIAGVCSDIGYRHKEGEQPNGKRFLLWCALGAVLATFIGIYGAGVPWLKVNRQLSWSAALAGGMYPFLIGDTIKIIVAVLLAGKFRERFA